MEQNFETCLYNMVDASKVQKDEPMKKHTTFRIGGPADYFIMPSNEKELAEAVRVCRKFLIPIYIVGNGSNLLVSDQGYEGVIIQIYKQMNQVEITENEIHAQAGALLSMIANRAMEAELTGFEFAAGIPGTLGGACVMNAGAYGGEMKDVLETVNVLTRDGDVKTLTKDELELGYRTSVIAKKDYIIRNIFLCAHLDHFCNFFFRLWCHKIACRTSHTECCVNLHRFILFYLFHF